MRNIKAFLTATLIIVMFIISNITVAANTSEINDKPQKPEKIHLKFSEKNDMGILNVTTQEPMEEATIRILNYKGKEIKTNVDHIDTKNNIVTLEQFDTGLYFIDIKALNVNITLPVIIK